MAATANSRKTISIYDYPEHLNPFHEDDNHNKIRFWTIGRKNRSNSISSTFSGIKDLKNSWAFRSFLKKGKKNSQEKSKSSQANGDTSPVMYRRALQYSSTSTAGSRSTVGSPERYIYGGSMTPLPRSRFQERLRSTSHYDTNSLSASPRMARSEVTGSRLSVQSTNPFDEEPVPPVRASRRKKKRAPPPPPASADVSITSETSELHISEANDSTAKSITEPSLDLEEMNINVELKIVEDEDIQQKKSEVELNGNIPKQESSEISVVTNNINIDDPNETDSDDKDVVVSNHDEQLRLNGSDSENNILDAVEFPKVDINKYRRNSSVNEDDIRLRRGNLEDFHSLSTKRSKSLTNALDGSHIVYDINLNEHSDTKDANGNDEPQKVICKLHDDNSRKQSITSTEKEFLEIDKATRELEREISKLNSALLEEEIPSVEERLSFSEIKRRFDKSESSSPNPIPKPRRSHYEPNSPVSTIN